MTKGLPVSMRGESLRFHACRKLVLRCLAFALLVVYIGWNLFQLYCLQVPASLLVALTGLPCPTTGGTRAFIALFQGDVVASLRWNPLAMPFALMGSATIARIAVDALRYRPIRLSNVWLYCWLILLGAGWAIQLTRHFTDVL